MNCPECGSPLFRYDEGVETCKNGHQWWADKDAPPESTGHLVSRTPLPSRPVERRRVPPWVAGAVLGGVALIVEVVRSVIS